MDHFTIHSCEQVLRFTRAEKWSDLSEERKVQLGFNLGAAVHSLEFTKEEAFLALNNAREGRISMQEFHQHLKQIIESRNVPMDQAMIDRPF